MKYSRFLSALLLIASLTAFTSAHSHTRDHSKMDNCSSDCCAKDTSRVAENDTYTCQMHPEVISDKPGKCPKCGMNLVKVKPLPNIKIYHKTQKDSTMSHPDKKH